MQSVSDEAEPLITNVSRPLARQRWVHGLWPPAIQSDAIAGFTYLHTCSLTTAGRSRSPCPLGGVRLTGMATAVMVCTDSAATQRTADGGVFLSVDKSQTSRNWRSSKFGTVFGWTGLWRAGQCRPRYPSRALQWRTRRNVPKRDRPTAVNCGELSVGGKRLWSCWLTCAGERTSGRWGRGVRWCHTYIGRCRMLNSAAATRRYSSALINRRPKSNCQ